MDLDVLTNHPFVQLILSWQIILLALGAYGMTFIARLFLQARWPKIKSDLLYTEFALPVAPIVNGGILAFLFRVTNVPWPTLIADNAFVQVLVGCIAGLFSGTIYARIRSLMAAKNTGASKPENSNNSDTVAPNTDLPSAEIPPVESPQDKP